MKSIRYYISKILGFILCLVYKKKINYKNILSVYFHNPSCKLFEECIKFIVKKEYRFISSDELNSIFKKDTLKTQKLAIITFDDGWRKNLKLLPIIEKYKVFSTFFITTDAIENGNFWWEYSNYLSKRFKARYLNINYLKKIDNDKRIKIINKIRNNINLKRSALTKQELINLSKNSYVSIGSHTISHPITIKCKNDELIKEYILSKKKIENWIHKEVKYFSYTNGNYNSRDIKFLIKANYKMAFTDKASLINLKKSIYEIPRYSINDNGSFSENKAKILGIWQTLLKRQ